MTQRQGNTLAALAVAVIVAQVACTAVLLRGQERTRKEAEAAQVSAQDVLEIQKEIRAAATPDATALQRTREELTAANAEIDQAKWKLIETRERLNADGAELEAADLRLQSMGARGQRSSSGK